MKTKLWFLLLSKFQIQIFTKKQKKLDFAEEENVFNGFIYYASFISELSEKSLRIQ